MGHDGHGQGHGHEARSKNDVYTAKHTREGLLLMLHEELQYSNQPGHSARRALHHTKNTWMRKTWKGNFPSMVSARIARPVPISVARLVRDEPTPFWTDAPKHTVREPRDLPSPGSANMPSCQAASRRSGRSGTSGSGLVAPSLPSHGPLKPLQRQCE